MVTLVCKACTESFETTHKMRQYCSRACKGLHWRLAQRLIDGNRGYSAVRLNNGMWCVFDTIDRPAVEEHTWFASRSGRRIYAATNVVHPYSDSKKTMLLMHRLLLGLEFGQRWIGEHRNGNGLDNRRRNLREATSQANRWNSDSVIGSGSQFKGVHWQWFRRPSGEDDKGSGKWRAQIMVDGKHRHLGLFFTEEEAAAAYDNAARVLHGDFARLNLPEPVEA